MKIRRGSRSRDVIDVRGQSRRAAGAGGRARRPLPGGKAGAAGGLGGIVVLVLVMVLGGGSLTGGEGTSSGGFDIGQILEGMGGGAVAPAPSDGKPLSGDTDEEEEFVSFVLDDVQDYWADTFAASGSTYDRARLVLFTQSVQSGCGTASSSWGPFYCGADTYVYIDLDFFDELSVRFGAPGDFAQAYVIAHEIGHHVQHLTGVSSFVRAESQKDPSRRNSLSISQELQADCLAGVWGHSVFSRSILETGDLEEGLAAAAAVGDDRIQRQSTGQVSPETWTHGSSEQRMQWFRSGFDTGDPQVCDTFSDS